MSPNKKIPTSLVKLNKIAQTQYTPSDFAFIVGMKATKAMNNSIDFIFKVSEFYKIKSTRIQQMFNRVLER